MSTVTDIILIGRCIEPEDKDYGGRPGDMARGILRLNEWLESATGRSGLKRINRGAGGGKALQADVFAAAYNCFDTDAFLAEVAECEWFLPETLTVLIQEEHDERGFTLYRLVDGKMQTDDNRRTS